MPVVAIKPGQLIVNVAETGEISVNQVTSGSVSGVTTNTLFDDATGNLAGAINALTNAIFKAVLILVMACLCFCGRGLAQGVLMQLPPVVDSLGHPIAGATITVYTATASGNPPTFTCNSPVTVYADVALLNPITTLTTDGFGNYPFFISASANPYGFKVSGQNTNTTLCYGFSAMVAPGSSPAFGTVTAGTVTAGTATAANLNGQLWVGSGAGQYSSMAACYAALPSTGGACHISPNWSETFTSNLSMSKSYAGFVFEGPANINLSTFSITVPQLTFGPFILGPSQFGGHAGPSQDVCTSLTGAVFSYAGTAQALMIGSPSGSHVLNGDWEDFAVCLTAAGSSAIGIDMYGVQQNLFKGVAVYSGLASNSQTCWRLNHDNVSDSEGNDWLFVRAGSGGGSCNIGFQTNGNSYNVYHLFLLGPGTNGSIAFDAEGTNAGPPASNEAANVYYIASGAYGTDVKCVWCFNNIGIIEGEAGLLSGPNATFDANSQNNDFRLGSQTAQSATDSSTAQNNRVCQAGDRGCLTGGGVPGCAVQNNLAAITGTGAAANVFTCTISGGAIQPGQAVRFTVGWNHNVGSASVTYQFAINGTPVSTICSCNTAGNGVAGIILYNQGSGQLSKIDLPSSIGSIYEGGGGYTAGISGNFSTGVTVSFTFNVANTDKVTPNMWVPEMLTH